MNTESHYDVAVIGSGPAGLNAAIAAAENNARVLIVEREIEVGGACIQYGTIPSKTLRETAVTLSAFQRRSGNVFDIAQPPHLLLESLMTRLSQVVRAHQQTASRYLEAAGVERIRGRAKFESARQLRIEFNNGDSTEIQADTFVIATGSRPRNPPQIPVDHENILDSDSILSMAYLPESLAVFGGGVIASEYASTFASLGVKVIMIDRYPTPLGFLDSELVDGYLESFRSHGGQFLGNSNVESVEWDGVSKVVTTLEDGTTIRTDKALVAQGRVANTDRLGLEHAGLRLNDRGLIPVSESFQTEVPWIYAVGDTIGPPALASASMEQGRRAIYHAFGLDVAVRDTVTPMGIYTIPEIGCVGMTEKQALEKFDKVLVGRAMFNDLARGQIMATPGGMLKLIADASGQKILGVQIVGDGATELIHVGQMAIVAETDVRELASTVFNFPTLAEAYRTAAIDILRQCPKPGETSEKLVSSQP